LSISSLVVLFVLGGWVLWRVPDPTRGGA
jgi:MFS-type transporter involved in bile tolerance (Atg22 family)